MHLTFHSGGGGGLKNMLFTFEPEETQILVSFNNQAIIGELRECWGDAPSIQVVLLISY